MTDEIVAPPVAPETKTDVLGHPWQAEKDTVGITACWPSVPEA